LLIFVLINMEGEIETEEVKVEEKRQDLDSKLVEWLRKHDLSGLVNNLRSYPYDLSLNDLCENWNKEDLCDLCKQMSVAVPLRVRFVDGIMELQLKRRQMKTQIQNNPKIQMMLEKVQSRYHVFLQQQSSQSDLDLLSENTKTRKTELEKEIKKETTWLINHVKYLEQLMLEEIAQQFGNVNDNIERDLCLKSKFENKITLMHEQLQDFLNFDFDTNVKNVELRMRNFLEQFEHKCDEYTKINSPKSNNIVPLKFHCNRNVLGSSIDQHFKLQPFGQSDVTSTNASNPPRLQLQCSIETIKKHLASLQQKTTKIPPQFKPISHAKNEEKISTQEKEKNHGNSSRIEMKEEEKKEENEGSIVFNMRSSVIESKSRILKHNYNRCRSKILGACLTLCTSCLWYWCCCAKLPSIPVPIPIRMSNLFTVASVVYRTVWSGMYKGNAIALQKNGLRAIKSQHNCKAVQVRAQHPLTPGHKYQWTVKFQRDKPGSNLGSFYFIGVVSEDVSPARFHNDPTTHRWPSAHGIDNSAGYYYFGKGFQKCPFKKERILSGDEVKVVAAYVIINKKKGELRLAYYRNGELMKPTNSIFSIVIPTHMESYFPCVSIWDKGTCCDLSFD